MSENTGGFDEAAAKAAGVVVEEPVYADYWGFDAVERYFLPDGKQYFELQRMTEGRRSRYQRETSSDVTLQRVTGDTKLRMDPAKERHALLEACVVGWHVMRKSPDGSFHEVPWDGGRGFKSWLEGADPRLVEGLEKACRDINPWLLNEQTVEAIDDEIESLKRQREAAVKRAAGE